MSVEVDWLRDRVDARSICEFIEQGVRRDASRDVQLAVKVGRGGLDETTALFTGGADIAVVAPIAALCLLRQFGDLQGLFALGVVPRRGCLVAAADAELPLRTVADLAGGTQCFTVATPADDDVSLVGFAVHRALRLAGVSAGDVRFIYDDEPAACFERFASGEADVVIHDPMSDPGWAGVAALRPVTYLPWGDRVVHGLAVQGWLPRTVPAGQLPGLDEDVTALDCSDFAVLCRADLDDELARLIARILTRGCRPAEVAAAVQTPLPLHPGAARAYADLVTDESLGSR
ncbi:MULTISPECIES: hypothetical protein [Streptomyces]|uniref:hypothetical protein n=1 Tax=Streptomyces TaxID=1883 RepID=UPI0033F58C8B